MSISRYDAVFTGFGASACILLHELHHNGWLKGKHLAIIEPSEKNTNDRTFCFWAEPDSKIVERFKSVISHSWENVALNGRISSISPLRYHHIRGIDLYRQTLSILSLYQYEWIHEPVTLIESIHQEAVVKLTNHTLITKFCFDSRNPEPPIVEFPEVAIHQTFLGYKVRLRHAAPDAGYATLMDFDIGQNGFTQFIYRLPFAPDVLLIELTRFGKEKIDADKSDPELRKYIHAQYGDFEILEKEYGCIPMVFSRHKISKQSGIITIGTRAGMVKPSTGYAFKNMYNHTLQIIDELKDGKATLKSHPSYRFRFYDQLLLIILLRWPSAGKKVFDQLLSNVAAKRILTFLNEQTSFREEMTIFSKLPVLIFLKALLHKEWYSLRKCTNEWMVLVGTLVALFVGLLSPGLRDLLVWPMLITGLILIGIPHGAVDDMLKGDGTFRKIDFRFIVVYLLQGLVMIMWWWFHAPSALIGFLLYSAWHFGQADLVESELQTFGTAGKASVFIQGAGTLAVILLSHVTELNEILQELTVPGISESWTPVSYLILTAMVFNGIFMRSRKLLIGYLTLAVSTQLPLLMAFGVYFIFQHSLRGWKHIRTKLKMNNLELFRSALPFHLGAWIMLALMYWILTIYKPAAEITGFGLIGIFFIFLSGLSFPHVIAMDGFYRRD